MDDLTLQDRVVEELKWDPAVNAEKIAVNVSDGVVTLMGTVASYAEKVACEKAVKWVKGVKGTAEEIEVKLGSSMVRSDTEIAHAALNALAANVMVPAKQIQVKDGRRSPSAPKPTRFLSQRFQRVAGEKAPPGLRGQYAVVRQGREVLGLVAVDGELGIWYTPRAEDQAELRRQGFRYSHHDLLGRLYFDLLAASAPRRAAATHPPAVAAPLSFARPASAAPAPQLEKPVLAGAATGRSR